jgi:hypothetical protein
VSAPPDQRSETRRVRVAGRRKLMRVTPGVQALFADAVATLGARRRQFARASGGKERKPRRPGTSITSEMETMFVGSAFCVPELPNLYWPDR